VFERHGVTGLRDPLVPVTRTRFVADLLVTPWAHAITALCARVTRWGKRAQRGIFAYITLGQDASALQSSLDVVLSRFAEYHGLEGAFARRAITERAKGILMERHSIDEKRAFEMLRDQARRSNRKIIEVAEAVTMSAKLLPRSQVDEPAATPPRG
jgi:AmiR/NasT family two-component response regulator